MNEQHRRGRAGLGARLPADLIAEAADLARHSAAIAAQLSVVLDELAQAIDEAEHPLLSRQRTNGTPDWVETL